MRVSPRLTRRWLPSRADPRVLVRYLYGGHGPGSAVMPGGIRMAGDLLTPRRIPDFRRWQSPETRVRWERGAALLAGMAGVVLVFFLLIAVLPLPEETEPPPITGQAMAPTTAAPPAVASPPPAATATDPAGQGPLVATSRAFPNVRRGPSLDAPIVGQLRPQQQVQVVGRSADNQWLQILNPANIQERLWVSADMLEVTGDVRTLPEAR